MRFPGFVELLPEWNSSDLLAAFVTRLGGGGNVRPRGAENATVVGGEFEKGLVVAERATAQYFPGLFPRSGSSISVL